MPASFSALVVCQQSSGSHESVEELLEERICTLCRRMGDRRGRSVGGGRGEANAVGRQASSGGRSVRGSGGGMY